MLLYKEADRRLLYSLLMWFILAAVWTCICWRHCQVYKSIYLSRNYKNMENSQTNLM